MVIRRPTKPAITTTTKPSSSTNKPSSSKPKTKPEPANSIGTVSFETFTANGVSFKMIRVDGGTFTMGATWKEKVDPDYINKPKHSVTLSSYFIGETEVTQALWETVMGNNPSQFKGSSRPVEMVSWEDCQIFIEKLNSLTGQHFRLPTEAEWEFAARGGNRSKGYKFSGSNHLSSVTWGDNEDETHPVKTKIPNELGIYNMSGNVQEWCQDYYEAYSSEPQTNPKGPETGKWRITRGGGWDCTYSYFRVFDRVYREPDFRWSSLGLRLAM